MSDSFLTKNLVDHYLQAEILKRLAAVTTPIRFSELKEDGIENSLFMYHANKLIDRGLVEKTDTGFVLSTKGARWVNHAGVLLDFNIETPRPLVQFIIHGKDETILVASRTGQLKQLLNSYMLPGDIYHYGITLEENAQKYLVKLFGEGIYTPELLTVADCIHKYSDGFTHHVITHIFEVKIGNQESVKTLDGQVVEWMPLTTIQMSNPMYSESPFLPMVLEKLGSLQLHETFIANT